MNLDALKLYCDVVRLRSFSRGAAANGISQSAASQAIQQLEGELDVPLLDRSRRPLVATKAGRVFFDACRGLLQGFARARSELLASKEMVDGTVRVAAIYSVGLHDMSRHMQPFMSAHPHARVLLECLHPHKVVEAVLNDEADLGVLSYPTASRTLAVMPLRSEPMVLVTHPSHRLAKRRLVQPGDLSGEKFVAFDRDLAVRRAIDRALRQHGVKVNVVMEFDNVETIKQAIGIAAGVSILPRPTVVMESGMRTLATVPLALPGLARPIGIIYRRGKQMPPAVSRFIDVLRKADDAQGGDHTQDRRDANWGSAGAIRGPR
ncbi:MAG TPA: LysR family transcriptional regulator [Methylomirabilota bacterium]|nr:LysR family transcriptional regulator [Methylomirabilota bacterium]